MRWPSYEPIMLRVETKSRARALQILYAWELQSNRSIPVVVSGISRLTGPEPRILDRAEELAAEVVAELTALDAELAQAADNWRMSRIATVERNILRLGIHELRQGNVPPKVAIDEAVRLAHWFGGARAASFVNGVLDGVAHSLGRL
jgi:transcription antitermination protein NusB